MGLIAKEDDDVRKVITYIANRQIANHRAGGTVLDFRNVSDDVLLAAMDDTGIPNTQLARVREGLNELIKLFLDAGCDTNRALEALRSA